MVLRPLLGLFVEPVDVFLELTPIDPPHPAPPDLDSGELAGTDERIDLRHADAQVGGHVVQGEEARFDLGHRRTIAAVRVGYLNLRTFALVWRPLAEGGAPWL